MTKKLKEQAARLWQDRTATIRLVEDAMRKLADHPHVFAKIKDEFESLLRLVKACVTGRYKQLPWTSILTSVAAIIYFVNPFDLVPDFIIGAGLLDDATVIAMAVNALSKDLAAFRVWEQG